MHSTSSMDGSPPAVEDPELKLSVDRQDDGTDAFPQHEECTAILTMKCGEPLQAVRKKLHDEIPITFIPEEGFGVFQSKVERHFSKLGPNYTQDKRAIFLKPSSNATQSKYVLLTKENFESLLRSRWKVARSMKVELKYEVFCYFTDASAAKKEKKRLSMKMFQQLPDSNVADVVANTAPNANFLPFQTGSAGYPLIQSYAEMSIDGTLTPVGAVKAGRTPNHKNGVREEATQASDRPRKVARGKQATATATGSEQLSFDGTDDAVWQTIPFRINGFVVPLEVDVVALRRCLGSIQPSSDAPPPSSSPGSTVSGSGLDPSSHL